MTSWGEFLSGCIASTSTPTSGGAGKRIVLRLLPGDDILDKLSSDDEQSGLDNNEDLLFVGEIAG